MEDEERTNNDLCNEEQMNITFDTANESLNQLVRPSKDVVAIEEDGFCSLLKLLKNSKKISLVSN